MPPKTPQDEPTLDDAAPAEQPAPDPSQVVYPIGVLIGEGVERTWIGEYEWVVDPETGRVTGRA